MSNSRNSNSDFLEIIPSVSFVDAMKRIRESFRIAHGYNIFSTVALFLIGIVLIVELPPFGIVCIIASVLQLIHTVNYKKYIPSLEEIEDLPKIMDYVEYRKSWAPRRFLRFQKDGKWGMYDTTLHKVVVEPIYTDIQWKKHWKTLLVTDDSGIRELTVNNRFLL